MLIMNLLGAPLMNKACINLDILLCDSFNFLLPSSTLSNMNYIYCEKCSQNFWTIRWSQITSFPRSIQYTWNMIQSQYIYQPSMELIQSPNLWQNIFKHWLSYDTPWNEGHRWSMEHNMTHLPCDMLTEHWQTPTSKFIQIWHTFLDPFYNC